MRGNFWARTSLNVNIYFPTNVEHAFVILNFWLNDRNLTTQHVATLLAQHLQAPGKRSQHSKATYCNIVGRNMVHVFGHPVSTCCDMWGIECGTSAHARAQHCCRNLANEIPHHATSTNAAWKIWPVLNLSQEHPTCRNMSPHVATVY